MRDDDLKLLTPWVDGEAVATAGHECLAELAELYSTSDLADAIERADGFVRAVAVSMVSGIHWWIPALVLANEAQPGDISDLGMLLNVHLAALGMTVSRLDSFPDETFLAYYRRLYEDGVADIVPPAGALTLMYAHRIGLLFSREALGKDGKLLLWGGHRKSMEIAEDASNKLTMKLKEVAMRLPTEKQDEQ